MNHNRKDLVKELISLYSEVPTFRCLPDCTDCCGPVFFSGLEFSRVKPFMQPNSMKCPYSKNARCSIYDKRPMVCRLFGNVAYDKLTCSFKCGPAFKISHEHGLWLINQTLRLSQAAGYGLDFVHTHKALLNHISPTKVKVSLTGYDFKR